MGRRTLLLIASILVAAVGTGLVALYVRTADVRAQAQEEQVTILIATQDIPLGTPGTQVQKYTTAESYPTRLAELIKRPVSAAAQIPPGQGTLSEISAGTPIRLDQFGADGGGGTTEIPGINPKKTIMTLAVDNPGILTYVHKGTRVMVWAGGDGSRKSPLLEDVQVVDVDAAASGTIYIEVTFEELKKANSKGSTFSVYPLNSQLETPGPSPSATTTTEPPQ